MKILIVIATLFAVWMSIDAASVISPDPQLWDKSSMLQFQNECIAKIKDDETFVMDSVNIKLTFLTVFVKIIQNIRREHSLESLDTMINNTCHPVIDEDQLYSMLIKVTEVCLNQQDPFTEEEKQMVKSKLKYTFCNLYMKLVSIITFSPECLSSNNALAEITSCTQGSTFSPSESVRSWFFPSQDKCKSQSNAINCVNNVISGKCDLETSQKIRDTLKGAASVLGCEHSEENFISANIV